MKAIQIKQFGGIEVLQLNEDAAQVVPASDQVLIEVYAAAINPFDSYVRGGNVKSDRLVLPITVAGDFSGVIKEVGKEVTELKVGDEVYGSVSVMNGGSGSLAHFATGFSKNMALKPKKTTFTQAAGAVLVGISALQALEEHIKLQKGQKILIHGGAGGIGSMAIQVAKMLGATVATTVSAADREFVQKLGADVVIDYKTEKFEEKLKDYDAVFVTAGQDTAQRSFKVLKKGGVIVSMLGQPDEALAQQQGVTAIGQNSKTTTERLQRLATLIDEGKVVPQIDTVFPLEQTQEAFRLLEEGSPNGKVVIEIKA
jgi:NADPH:quinone reductase-like Zn-dependent oxidoreductase